MLVRLCVKSEYLKVYAFAAVCSTNGTEKQQPMDTGESRQAAWDVLVTPASAVDEAVGLPPGLGAPAASAVSEVTSSAPAHASAASNSSAQRKRGNQKKQKYQKTTRESAGAARPNRDSLGAGAASSRPNIYQLKGLSNKHDASRASASDDD